MFTRSNAWISALICWLTRSQASHVVISGLMVAGVPVILHANIGGVHVVPRDKFLASSKRIAEFTLLPAVDVAGAVKDIGTRYDYAGMFGMGIVLAARWIGKKIRNPLQAPHAVICSELVLALDPTGTVVAPWKGLDHGGTSPGDLLRLCMEYPTTFLALPSQAIE